MGLKFREIFPSPWYEYFITTAPVGTHPQSQNEGYGLTVQAMPYVYPATPQLVAGQPPAPDGQHWVDVEAGIRDFSLWDALPQYSLDAAPVQNGLSFDDSEVRNFYVLNPLWLSNQLASRTICRRRSRSFLLPGSIPPASTVTAIGLRSARSIGSPTLMDWRRKTMRRPALASLSSRSLADLALKKISYHEPTPNMLRGDIVTNLRPDIMPGNRLIFAPFKDTEQ
jgi:uncharacterized protein YjiS (DUF1127 family)